MASNLKISNQDFDDAFDLIEDEPPLKPSIREIPTEPQPRPAKLSKGQKKKAAKRRAKGRTQHDSGVHDGQDQGTNQQPKVQDSDKPGAQAYIGRYMYQPSQPKSCSSSKSSAAGGPQKTAHRFKKNYNFSNSTDKSDEQFFLDCYRLRANDDYNIGRNPHGLYAASKQPGKEAETKTALIKDLLTFVLLAEKNCGLPENIDWDNFMTIAAQQLAVEFSGTACDDSYGSRPAGHMTHVAEKILGTPAACDFATYKRNPMIPENTKIFLQFEKKVKRGVDGRDFGKSSRSLFEGVGGIEAWTKLFEEMDLSQMEETEGPSLGPVPSTSQIKDEMMDYLMSSMGGFFR